MLYTWGSACATTSWDLLDSLPRSTGRGSRRSLCVPQPRGLPSSVLMRPPPQNSKSGNAGVLTAQSIGIPRDLCPCL